MGLKKLRTTMLAGGMSLLATGAGAGAGAQTLELATDLSPAGLDPHIATAFATHQVTTGLLYEGLTGVDQDLSIVPVLAESWTVSPDGLTYTFTLRDGVTFHDGSPMDAEDVVSSIARVQSKDIASPLASRVSAVETATAVDPRTVELKLKEPSAPLLSSLTSIAIVPSAVEADKEALQQAPVGTGPFLFQEWQPNGHLLLARNDAYWQDGVPKLDALKFNIVPESATRQVGLVNGQYHMLPHVDAATALQLQGQPGVKLEETLDLAYILVGMNTSAAPFDDAKVREAVNYAINRDDIVQAALFGAGVPAGPLSPALRQWALDVSEYPCYQHDPAKARALLEEAGVEMPVKVTINVLPRQDIRDVAQVVQAQLNEAGFAVELNNQEQGQFVQDWRNSNFQMFASLNAGSVDPDEYFYRAFRTGGSTNVFKYSDPEMDALLDQGRSTQDQAARKEIYDQVQRTLACSGPAAHIAYSRLATAARDEVQGYSVLATRSLATLAGTTIGR